MNTDTKDAVLKLKGGKTLYGVVIEQNIATDSIALISYKNLPDLGLRAIQDLLDLIPKTQVLEIDYCMK